MRPTAPVRQPHRCPLGKRQSDKGCHQARLDIGDRVRLTPQQTGSQPLPTPRLTHPEQVADRIVEQRNLVPVFVSIGKRLCDSILDTIDPDRSQQSPTETGLGIDHEGLELSVAGHRPNIPTHR